MQIKKERKNNRNLTFGKSYKCCNNSKSLQAGSLRAEDVPLTATTALCFVRVALAFRSPICNAPPSDFSRRSTFFAPL